MSKNPPITLTVPEAGKKYFGLSRNGSYDAAARGDLPTIRIGKLVRVPVRALEAMLDRASEPRRSWLRPRTRWRSTISRSQAARQRRVGNGIDGFGRSWDWAAAAQ